MELLTALLGPIIDLFINIGAHFTGKEKIDVSILWDDYNKDFCINIINNTNKTISLESISLGFKNGILLGERKPFMDCLKKDNILMPKQYYSFVPLRGALCDIFAYKGHLFDVDESNKDEPIYIFVKYGHKKEIKIKTKYTFEEIDKIATTYLAK